MEGRRYTSFHFLCNAVDFVEPMTAAESYIHFETLVFVNIQSCEEPVIESPSRR